MFALFGLLDCRYNYDSPLLLTQHQFFPTSFLLDKCTTTKSVEADFSRIVAGDYKEVYSLSAIMIQKDFGYSILALCVWWVCVRTQIVRFQNTEPRLFILINIMCRAPPPSSLSLLDFHCSFY